MVVLDLIRVLPRAKFWDIFHIHFENVSYFCIPVRHMSPLTEVEGTFGKGEIAHLSNFSFSKSVFNCNVVLLKRWLLIIAKILTKNKINVSMMLKMSPISSAWWGTCPWLSEVKITKKYASKSFKLKVLDVWDKDGWY